MWLYQAPNLADSAAVAALDPLWRRAAAAGYTRVLLADPKFGRLGQLDAAYIANVARVRRLADRLGLEIVPGVFLVGRANAYTAVDPNLAEALPVRGARFVVRGGIARLVPDPPVSFGERPEWVDPGVTRSGGIATMRDHALRARVVERVGVSPFRCYHVSVAIRTADYTGRPQIRVVAGRRALSFTELGVRATQDWTTHHVVFNSLDHRRVDVLLGGFRPARGTLEWKDWRIEECGPVNLVRRAGAPFALDGAVEGRDVEPVRDSLAGRSPWPGHWDVWHEPPAIRSSLPDGATFRASWYHAAIVARNQVAVCLSDTATMARLADESRRVRALFAPRRVMMMHDEIRALGWDAACAAKHETPGRLLADHARACRRLLEGARTYVWGDMFDPQQNATRAAWFVNGDLAGSWEGLDPDVVVVNWNLGRLASSARFFASRGHAQVVAGYYDGDVEDTRRIVELRARVPRIEGLMYTTWEGRYDDLERFAEIARRR